MVSKLTRFYLSFILRAVDECGHNLYCSFPHAPKVTTIKRPTHTQRLPSNPISSRSKGPAELETIALASLLCVHSIPPYSLQKNITIPLMIRPNRLADKPRRLNANKWGGATFIVFFFFPERKKQSLMLTTTRSLPLGNLSKFTRVKTFNKKKKRWVNRYIGVREFFYFFFFFFPLKILLTSRVRSGK